MRNKDGEGVQKVEEARYLFDNKLEPMPGVCFQGCTHVHMNTHNATWMHSQKGQVSTPFPSCGSIVRNSAGVPNNPADITLQHKGTSNLSPAKESKTRGGGKRKVRIQKYFLQDILQQPQSSSGNQFTKHTMSTVTILYRSWIQVCFQNITFVLCLNIIKLSQVWYYFILNYI